MYIKRHDGTKTDRNSKNNLESVGVDSRVVITMKEPEGISPPYMNNSFGCISMSGYPNSSNVPIGAVQNDIQKCTYHMCKYYYKLRF